MQIRLFQRLLFFVAFLALFVKFQDRLVGQQVINNSMTASSNSTDVTAEDLEQLKQQLPVDNAQLVTEVEAILGRAQANLNQAASYQDAAEINRSAIQEVDNLAKSFRDREPAGRIVAEDWKDATTEVLDRMVQDQANATSLSREQSEQAATELAQRIARRQQVRERLAVVSQTSEELELRLKDLDVDEGWVGKANLLELKTRTQTLTSEARNLNSELERLDAENRVELPRLKAEFLSQQTEARQALLDSMQAKLNNRRAEEAVEKERQILLSKLGEEPALQSSFQRNVRLAEENREVAGQLTETELTLKNRTELLKKIKVQFKDAKSRVIEIGLSDSVGAMLRNEKDQLPNTLDLSPKANEGQFREVQFQLFDVTQQLQDLSESAIREEILEAMQLDSAELKSLAESIEELTKQRRELLDSAKVNFQAQYKNLINLELVNSQLVAVVVDYRGFINERILWIRSNQVLFTSLAIDPTDRTIFNSGQWSRVSKLAVKDWNRNLWTYLFSIGGILLLLILKSRMRKAVDEFGVEASRGSCSSFWPTGKSLLLSALLALIVPLILLFVGWRWSQVAASNRESGKLISALASAFLLSSWFAIPVEILKRFCRKAGLGHKHFNWSNEGVQTIRSNLNWASPVGSLLVFGVAFFYYLDTRHQNDLIERVLFLAGMVTLAIVLYRCMHPGLGVFRNYLRQHEKSWANQLRWVWFGLLIGGPVVLGLLAVIGYFYTSLNLAVCVFMTFVFGLVVETLRALLMRFILVRRRHAHIELARRRRMAIRSEKKAEAEEQGELAGAVGNRAFTDSELLEDFNVDENATQSRKLIGLSLGVIWFLGLWLIWTDVLPALRALDRYPVWPPGATAVSEFENVATAGSLTDGVAAEQADARPSEDTLPRITIRDLLVFFLISMITFVLARNLPGLIEMTFLNHLPVEPSVRFASKSILSYLIVLLGVVLAFRSVQIGWSQVQWLATALTFGLAFGLQEIFANFVAGIILLFERPIRIGDVITVDDVTGVVTKIRTRATTISNWDRKEYVIPNKEFITGRVLNWTLTDQLNRIVIKVGVAYGTDVDQAKQLLLNICQEHPMIVEQPPSNVTFEEFGDSALGLTVRTFVPNIDCRLTVIDQLHTSINNVLTEAGIEISFPQMDLHFRSADDSLVKSLKEGSTH